MDDHRSPPPATRDALAQIERDYPGWECWVGTLPHLLYARRLRTSPPAVVRAATVEKLRAQVHDTEAERAARGGLA
jgi:hypothetical protein